MYTPEKTRYDHMTYRRCGKSGLLLPAISLGLWHNFGAITPFEAQKSILRTAFDHGVTHFDLANNYGPPYGEAERNFGVHMERDWRPHRDELVISTKAGYDMWAGPYGDHGSRKYLLSSLDQSLKRMKLDYVDIFYHHRPDPETPLEETMGALASAIHSGKALYVGVSNYPAELLRRAAEILRGMGVKLLIHQPRYSMLSREPEEALFAELSNQGVGCIAFCPLAGGRLTSRYMNGIPTDSRAGHDPRFLKAQDITPELLSKIKSLNEIAMERGQTLAQMSLCWVLRRPEMTSALIGASKPEQVMDNVRALDRGPLTESEIARIDEILARDEI